MGPTSRHLGGQHVRNHGIAGRVQTVGHVGLGENALEPSLGVAWRVQNVVGFSRGNPQSAKTLSEELFVPFRHEAAQVLTKERSMVLEKTAEVVGFRLV